MLKLILFLLITATSPFEAITTSRQVLSTPIATLEPEGTASLFYGDTCEPPCWFGLIPGESTLEDVIRLFQGSLHLFGAFIPDIIDYQGGVSSDFQVQIERYGLTFMWTRGSNGFFGTESYLAFYDGTLSSMQIKDNDNIILDDVIRILGTPNHVRASVNRITANSDYVGLILFYPERNFAAYLKADPEDCRIRDMGSDFRLDGTYYYSSEQAETFETDSGLDQYQLVPADVWNMWLMGNSHATCLGAIWSFFKAISES